MTLARRVLFWLSAAAMLGILTVACRAAPGGVSSPQATAVEAPPVPSVEPAPAKQVRVPEQPLGALWAAWDILRNNYVYKERLQDVPKLSQAGVKAVLESVADPQLSKGPLLAANAPPPRGMPKELKPVWDGWAAIYENYHGGKPLDEAKLGQEMIRAFIRALDDPHTEYLSPDRYPIDSQDFQGNYGGIGAEIHNRNGRFLLNPMPTSPAEKAGLKAGDTLLAVEGQPIDGWSVLQVVSRIRGKSGTPVTLTIQPIGSKESANLTVRRDTIRLESVFWNMTNEGFAYMRLSFFYDNTPSAFRARLQEAIAQGAKGVVLDLRNNPGGFLRATVDVASEFLGEELVLFEVDGTGKRTDWHGRRGGLGKEVPLVVLVNQFSASGSEVLAGALQDLGRAQLVGVPTFGKGSVNLFRGLPDGGGLYFTYGRWFTPKGRQIDEKGLEPDHMVIASVSGRGGDTQLNKALEVLRQLVPVASASP